MTRRKGESHSETYFALSISWVSLLDFFPDAKILMVRPCLFFFPEMSLVPICDLIPLARVSKVPWLGLVWSPENMHPSKTLDFHMPRRKKKINIHPPGTDCWFQKVIPYCNTYFLSLIFFRKIISTGHHCIWQLCDNITYNNNNAQL